MNRISQRPITTRPVLTDRPNTAHYTIPSRLVRNSLYQNPPTQPQFHLPFSQDTGTSTSPLKFFELEASAVPIQNITFKVTPPAHTQRKRRVLVVKYLKNNEILQKTKSKSSNRSLIRFFEAAQQQESRKKSPNSRIRSSSRPVTSKSQGPVNRRLFSDITLDYPAGSRLFDICEVLSIAQGEINLRNLKLKR